MRGHFLTLIVVGKFLPHPKLKVIIYSTPIKQDVLANFQAFCKLQVTLLNLQHLFTFICVKKQVGHERCRIRLYWNVKCLTKC